MPPLGRRNIELKAELRDRPGAQAVCEALGAEARGDLHQTDTYFRVPHGRLKLRACEPGEDYLIFYLRPDESAIKASDYTLCPAPPGLLGLLAAALGIRGEVRKVRTLYQWENVRIHLDRVEGLGDFIEFEAVLDAGHGETDGWREVAFLRDRFGLGEADLRSPSYLDLLEGMCAGEGR